jgi:subtilisin family serine protease
LISTAALLVVFALTACTEAYEPAAPSGDAARALVAQYAVSPPAAAAGDHVLVLASQSAPSSALLTAIQANGGSVLSRYDRIGVVVVRGLSDAAAATLRDRADVEAASRDEVMQWQPTVQGLSHESIPVQANANPADAFFYAFQWNMRQIQADRAWEITPRGEGALVCILDSGIDPTHIDLQGRVDLGSSASFIAEPDLGIPGLEGQVDILDYRFHGTFVASQVATNGQGMASVAPNATLCAVKVLNVFGTGPFEGVIAGVLHAVDVRADVINMSLGAYLDWSTAEGELKALLVALQRAILHATSRGVLVVASSGNDGANLDADGSFIHVPSQMLGVVSVSATGPQNQMDFDGLAPYSNFGRTGVTLAAPGGNAGSTGNGLDGILGACSSFQLALPFACTTSDYVSGGDGTSFAAPHVSGLAAVVESAARGNQFGLVLSACAIAGADRIDGQLLSPAYGFGRIDVFDSVQRFGCGRSLFSWR